jgi:AcrR family transcriptional regulator
MATRKRPRIKLTGGPHGIPRELVQEVQRGRMLDAAADVIAEEGYLDATVHKILKRAGISRRTFYEIFKDKQDCFLEAYQEAVDQAFGLVREACAEADTPEARVEGGLRALLRFAEREPKLARMCVVEVMAAGDKVRARRSETMDRLAALAADALEERCDSREEALLRARVLTGGVHEMVYDALARGRSRGLADLADDVVASYLPPPEVVHGG